MSKRKERNADLHILRSAARICVINIPTTLLLACLLALQKIGWVTALVAFALIFFITAVIAKSVFKEFENFAKYLQTLAQGLEIELPRFNRGIFGFSRIAEAFGRVKSLWFNQTISDASILENLPDPLLMLSGATEIVFANRSACSFFGEDLLNRAAGEIFEDDLFQKAIAHVVQHKTPHEWFEWCFHDDAPTTFLVRIERLPAQAKSGAIAVVSMHDITAFKLFKKQQSDFFANASHELKTPLSILSGFIETLQGPARDDVAAREKFLKMMADQTERMTHLVQDLLMLSQLQMTEKVNQSDVILIPSLLQSVIEGLRIKAAAHAKTISFKPEHELPRLMGNRAELHQVFQNLIDNAVKYGEENSAITVKTRLCNGFPKKSDRYFSDMRQVIAISVHNTGNPISGTHVHRLFERFYRVDSLRSRLVEGTGLGLGIAQQIVAKHDGVIDVESSAAAGTTFSVYLPLDL